MYTFILFKISNMTELCCWISRNWACWTCCACCICWACRSSSCFFLISVLLDAMKFPFHASQKNMKQNHWMLTYEIFFANLHLYHFLSFSWSRQMFPVRYFAYFVAVQTPLQLWIFFSCWFLFCSISFIELLNQIM